MLFLYICIVFFVMMIVSVINYMHLVRYRRYVSDKVVFFVVGCWLVVVGLCV